MGKIFVSAILVFFSCLANAQSFVRLPEYESNLYGEMVYVSGEYETMKSIRAYWVRECNKLKNKNCEFVLCGNTDGVMKVTIPTRVLFQQNDTTLTPAGEGILRPLLQFLIGEEDYSSCIIACYTDNNGSEKYLTSLSKARAGNVYRWLLKQGVPAELMKYYGHGSKVNRTQNDNVKNRELNRRLSIYFVPNKKMLKLAKKGKLI